MNANDAQVTIHAEKVWTDPHLKPGDECVVARFHTDAGGVEERVLPIRREHGAPVVELPEGQFVVSSEYVYLFLG